MICTETSELALGDVSMSSILVVKKQKLEWKMWRGSRHLCVLALLALSNFHNCGFSCDLSQRWLSLGCCEKEPRNCHYNTCNLNLPLGTLCSSSTSTTRHYTMQTMGIAFWTHYVRASGETFSLSPGSFSSGDAKVGKKYNYMTLIPCQSSATSLKLRGFICSFIPLFVYQIGCLLSLPSFGWW